MPSKAIYMDNHATTPVDPRVLDAMLPYFSEIFGNAGSRTHGFGWEAEKAVETGREQVARLIGAKTKDVIFTSGATESDNLAIKGALEFYKDKGNHVITTTTEQQAKSANDVATSMQDILNITQQTTEGTKRTAVSIGQLAELAKELKGSVSGFKIG